MTPASATPIAVHGKDVLEQAARMTPTDDALLVKSRSASLTRQH